MLREPQPGFIHRRAGVHRLGAETGWHRGASSQRGCKERVLVELLWFSQGIWMCERLGQCAVGSTRETFAAAPDAGAAARKDAAQKRGGGVRVTPSAHLAFLVANGVPKPSHPASQGAFTRVHIRSTLVVWHLLSGDGDDDDGGGGQRSRDGGRDGGRSGDGDGVDSGRVSGGGYKCIPGFGTEACDS